MIKIIKLLEDIDFQIYQATCRIAHNGETTVQTIGEILRGMPGVLTVVQVEHDPDKDTAIMKVKIITKKSPKEGFKSFVSTTLERVKLIRKIEVAENTIEQKK